MSVEDLKKLNKNKKLVKKLGELNWKLTKPNVERTLNFKLEGIASQCSVVAAHCLFGARCHSTAQSLLQKPVYLTCL